MKNPAADARDFARLRWLLAVAVVGACGPEDGPGGRAVTHAGVDEPSSSTVQISSDSTPLPLDMMLSGSDLAAPVDNAGFYPPSDATPAPALAVRLAIEQTRMLFEPEIPQPVCDGSAVELGGSCRGGHDKRLLPAFTLDLFTAGEVLAAIQIGEMLGDERTGGSRSYWHVIPQYGRVWRQPGDGDWSRAAFALMLVHDMENHAHQGLASFLYAGGEATDLRFQFVQQTAPFNIPVHFVAWGAAKASFEAVAFGNLEARRARVDSELAARLPLRPWGELVAALADEGLPEATLEGFGGLLPDDYVVAKALVRDGVVYHQGSQTPYGPYPYPQEMRFGPRSVAKSVTVPLALGRLAQVYGPYVLDLKIGDYVAGLDPEYDEVRFIDAANMATGMGGHGSSVTSPNSTGDGYVDDTYDDWYNGAFSNAEKITSITENGSPYPWGAGIVMRYRDRDFHLLGAATDGFLRSARGPDADIWEMLEEEVLAPIGIHHAPIVRTREADGELGLPWFHAGIYVTLDDVAKIFTLYQNLGQHDGEQLLHRGLAAQIFSTEGAITKETDLSVAAAFGRRAPVPLAAGEGLYKMGFHLTPHVDLDGGAVVYLPGAFGAGSNQVIMYPQGLISIRMAKVWDCSECQGLSGPEGTIAAVNRLLGTLVR